jgi:hypothetical protein
MSRRSQSHRRRTYGRRQHEVRERRTDTRQGTGLLGEGESEFDINWRTTDGADDGAAYGESLGGYGR